MTRSSPKADAEPLARYRDKRDFRITPEPPPGRSRRRKALTFVIQKHWASRLHYDFRLELDGVLLSWAIPKGPSLDPKDKRMAIHVEDHPVGYGSFEGEIPKGQYGAGTVIVWDSGTWEPEGDPHEAMIQGKLAFRLRGHKLAGLWELVRIRKPDDRQDPWLLFKKRDEWARPRAEYDVIAALPDSVAGHPPKRPQSRPVHSHGEDPPAAGLPDLSLARKATLPDALAPQLATLADALPAGGRWRLEPKWDGYRLLARVDRRGVRLFTRNGHDWTDRLRPIADAVASLGLRRAWVDGEIVVLDDDGAPDFNRLQNAIDTGHDDKIVYFAFDLPYDSGLDLRAVPLESRRARLAAVFEKAPPGPVRFSPSFDEPIDALLKAACALKLEGLVAKRADAPYVSRRTDTWLKLKCGLRQEFVVIGYDDRRGTDAEVGSLLLATREGRAWRYAGRVGTGWNRRDARELHARLSRLAAKRPVVDPDAVKAGRWARREVGSPHWVEPRVVVEVAFTEWTPDGKIRHGAFRGVRTDKAAGGVVREDVGAGAGASKPAPERRTAVKVTHPDRVVDPSTGLNKLDLVRYYESVAERMMPHLAGRPVSLLRAPEGIGGALFFQKHAETRMPGLTELDPALWPDHKPLLAVASPEALVAAAQMNVVEFHTWNSTTRRIDRPDRIVLDLDPGDGVPWSQMREAALLVRDMLDLLGLRAWLKTSGGKGLHVVVPLQPALGYPAVKTFSQALVQHLAHTIPQRFVAKSGPANRVGKIFVDYLRNGLGQTTVAAFSARARPGLGVSMPVSWEQLPDITSGAHWTISTAREYLGRQTVDPWEGYASTKQRLTKAAAMLTSAAAGGSSDARPTSSATSRS